MNQKIIVKDIEQINSKLKGKDEKNIKALKETINQKVNIILP